jgi:hypothetical protein
MIFDLESAKLGLQNVNDLELYLITHKMATFIVNTFFHIYEKKSVYNESSTVISYLIQEL